MNLNKSAIWAILVSSGLNLTGNFVYIYVYNFVYLWVYNLSIILSYFAKFLRKNSIFLPSGTKHLIW